MTSTAPSTSKDTPPSIQSSSQDAITNSGLNTSVEIGKYIALDCEMVGIGPSGLESALARITITNYTLDQIYDSYVLPTEQVTDWRTPVSGMRPQHMTHARTFKEVQTDVARIMKGRIVVGHALRHDFAVLKLSHPRRDLRDTARHGPYRALVGGTPKLSLLASELLGLEIQSGEHSSLEDARAAMLLFKRDKNRFETKERDQVRRRG
ncbi:hypothetical protein BT93_L1427 [Corymbia citriodora subsp. variegata]|uniref:RNA exonuclease 4 n=1 Tax=Corymbia citriodora subsp. variegata TaxID=360336 RepID=A0A8T0CED1_CORYI|nr:hypothetical protein BT93_L1427 [Corymbia citriodora subsp. variegata]